MSITWDDDAVKRVAQEAGKKAMEIARAAAAGTPCPEHGTAAEVTGVDPTTGQFTIKACCETGKEAALDSIRQALPSP